MWPEIDVNRDARKQHNQRPTKCGRQAHADRRILAGLGSPAPANSEGQRDGCQQTQATKHLVTVTKPPYNNQVDAPTMYPKVAAILIVSARVCGKSRILPKKTSIDPASAATSARG